MHQLEKLLSRDLSKLPDDASRLKLLRKETSMANPEACWGRFVINTCNRMAVEIMLHPTNPAPAD